MGEFAIGQSVLRREDPRLLRGQGRFFDDLKLADQLHAAIVRSPYAHADIAGIDTRAALKAPGVHAVLTGEDYRADGLGSLPSMAPYKTRSGAPMFVPPRPALARERVMHVGYPVAVVVADTLDQARDAAERVGVAYKARAAVVSARDAFAPTAPQLYDQCPRNEAYLYQAGDKAKVEGAFAGAAHVIEQRLVINRVTANPLEPRGVIGIYDAGTGRYTLHCGFQRPWLFRNDIARTTLNIPEAELRLITGDIGGSYGLRGSIYPEIILMLWAARRVGRPVKWTQTRAEAHISDDDARDNIVDAALALDRDGKFLAVRIRSFGNLGAFVSFRGAMPPVVNIGTVVGTYTTPALHVEVSGMLTNTHCTSPYRGAGRPEASYMIERLIDIAADELAIDPAELRRRNTIPPHAMPYKTPLTFTYDSGRFEENLDRAMRLADWAGFTGRRKEAARRGMLRGIGISNTIEQAGDPTYETAELRFDPLGGVTLVTGSISHGQGHATIQTQILADRLGVDPLRVKIIQGDTDAVAFGMGTGGSRSTTMSGSAIAMVSDKIIAKGKKLAAHILEAAERDIEFNDGRFAIAGTDRALGIHDVAKAAFQLDKLPAGMEPGLYEIATFRARTNGNYPNGCHVCEVEIDPDTGRTQLVGYWVVDDVGTVINPMLLEGQIMGGIAQGIGQVLMEDKAYDAAGQVLAGSFMDYAMPRADDFGLVVIEDNPVPTPTNPLGVKGAGEAGTVGSLSAGVNAIVDALSVLGIRHIDTPCTPYRVWQAITKAGRR
ncbi:MAG TPA: xanthine dehydrogenase family protein molybdopterin-binding subunit [Xanthobacteraceae bacterium]|nr:xanthine dehydrogenase family protein molybdopterin-binding subunit [Xanthobacteraceae bacterium]